MKLSDTRGFDVTGSTINLAANTLCALTIAVIVAFIHSWQANPLHPGMRALPVASLIQMRPAVGRSSEDQAMQQQSRKVLMIISAKHLETVSLMYPENIQSL
ncbi:unnamed protein product [Oreochromis niloticus]|nr:unnamed protein product [Mustela putorius furo]